MEIKKSMWAVGIRYEGAFVLFATKQEAEAFIAKVENEDVSDDEEFGWLTKFADLYLEELPIR